MDTIDKIYYKDSKRKFKKFSNDKLIMKALYTLLNDVNQLKAIVPSSYSNVVSTEALKDVISDRIYEGKND